MALSCDWHAAHPSSFTGLCRTQSAATDGARWFFSWQYGLERTDLSFNSLQRNGSFTPPASLVPGILSSVLGQGLDHFGDVDVYNCIRYASLDTTRNDAALGYSDGHGRVAVDGAAGLGNGKAWQNGNTINVYQLGDRRFSHTLTLDRSLQSIQGAKVFNGALYLSSDNATQSVCRAELAMGHVDEPFQLPALDGDREVEGIALRALSGGGAEMVVELIVEPGSSGNRPGNANQHVDLYHYQLAPMSEPASVAMLLAGLTVVGALLRRRREA
jgi:hypothetical protein